MTPAVVLLKPGDGLIVVDAQRDFLPGGALAVPGGDAVLAPIQACLGAFAEARLAVFATRDWHPVDHLSFRARGGPWPPHCVAGTPGAAFAPELPWPAGTTVVSKGGDRDREAYSGFAGTDLSQRLRRSRVRRVFVCGLATDYCVLRTVLDARWLGFDVVVLRDAIAAVDAQPGDGERALEKMLAAGAVLAVSAQLQSPVSAGRTAAPGPPGGGAATGGGGAPG